LQEKNGKIKIEKYFTKTFDEKAQSFEEAVEEISNVMEDSVNKHLLSDVEVGSFLSSGIDSSYIVSLSKPDKTYTVGYDLAKYNEIAYAKDLADKLNIRNTSKVITKEEYMQVMPKIMYHLDEPASDPAAVALYFLSHLPIIKNFDKFGGIAYGIFRAYIIIYFVLAILSLLSPLFSNIGLNAYIKASHICSKFYNNNIFLKIFS